MSKKRRDESQSPIFSKHEFARLVGVAPNTILRWSEEGRLPEPIRLTSQCYRWRRDDVVAWIEAMCSASDQTRPTGGSHDAC